MPLATMWFMAEKGRRVFALVIPTPLYHRLSLIWAPGIPDVYLVKFLKNILQDNMQLLNKKSRALFSRNPKKNIKLGLTSVVCLFIFREIFEFCLKGREYLPPGLFFN